MSTLTAILSYLGWHISLMVLVWGVFLGRFNPTARGFLDLRFNHGWESQVLRWGFLILLDLLLPAALAMPAFYYTSFVQPVGCIILGSAWLGFWGFFFTLTLMVLLRMGSKSCCCCVGRPRRRHWHRHDNPNQRRHSRPSGDSD
jgi:hypothetical protein